ncbi:MAG: hypothetical protein SNJ75_03160, partial [Gemmataceae bacterium]
MRAFFACSLVVLAAAWLLAADPSTEPNDQIKDRKSFFPWRNYQPLKGKTVGLLVSDVAAFMGYEGRGGPPDAMGFSVNGQSYRWIYVPVSEKPIISNLQVEVGEKAGTKTKLYPALNMANATEVSRWDIKVPYALVEVEVNDGEGAPPGEGFVATRMKRLDAGVSYPLDVNKALAMVRARHDKDLKNQQAKIAQSIEQTANKVLKDEKLTGPRETKTVLYVTWLAKREVLRAAFRTTVHDGAFRFVEGGGARPRPIPVPLPVPPGPGGAKPGGVRPLAFFPPPPPPRFQVRVGTAITAELGFAYEVDKAGQLIKRQTLPLQVKSEELPLPPI